MSIAQNRDGREDGEQHHRPGKASTTSLLEPMSSERTASTIGVIGWYLAKGWSQPGIVFTGT